MNSSPVKRPTTQVYENYTKSDFEVWKLLYDRQTAILEPHICSEYKEAIKAVNFSADRIPNFDEVEERLKPLTGWGLKTVPNISEQKIFFQFLSQKRFTATCWLRTMEQLDYLEEPDMFHDVFGHVPLLSNKEYTDFFQAISEIALEHIDNPHIIELLGRVYWFTIEFGLIRENGELKIYGAGIISSKGETEHCMSENCEIKDFSVQEIFDTSFRTDILQDTYFAIQSFDQLYLSIPEIRRRIGELT